LRLKIKTRKPNGNHAKGGPSRKINLRPRNLYTDQKCRKQSRICLSNQNLQKGQRSVDPRRSCKQRRNKTMSLSIATPRGKTNRVLGRQFEEGRTPTPSRLSLLRRTKGRSLRAAKWTEHISQYNTRLTSLNAATIQSTKSSWQRSGATAAQTLTSRTKL
jgi:hypothetical protein